MPVTYTTDVGGDVAQLGERRTRIAEVVGSNPIVSTRNSLMDGGFSEAPPPSASQSAPACIPVEEQELCSVSELVDYPSWRPSPRRPDDRQTQALKDTEKTAIDSFEATVARSIMKPW